MKLIKDIKEELNGAFIRRVDAERNIVYKPEIDVLKLLQVIHEILDYIEELEKRNETN